MQFTVREIMGLRVPLMIWLAITAVAAVSGPFGTLDAMGIGGRVLYWGGVAGISIGLSLVASLLTERLGPAGAIGIWVGLVLVISGGAHLVNSYVFSAWGGVVDWLYLTGIVGLVTAAVHLVIWGISAREDVERVSEVATFLRRLPIEFRGPLVRIEAQDHYLNVVTARGQTLILMRLGDAMGELVGQGLQVHRSHWIAPAAVEKHRREGGRDLLVMSDGADVPVSRSFRGAAQEAGVL